MSEVRRFMALLMAILMVAPVGAFAANHRFDQEFVHAVLCGDGLDELIVTLFPEAPTQVNDCCGTNRGHDKYQRQGASQPRQSR